ncbi:Sphingosine-1-phosphate lyase [Erysiphe neolycopersici]|uniref:sphinganine-1-phosphate aldolase n=1 Tax=Erysiphe neolycopersici TaxID=212602 RepID=A0A420HBI7_9PEZI|nr:Sphingosine-1-phosphate lyase [Erysiphe neolycopersici]
MSGTSRMPISLRNTINVKKHSSISQLITFQINLLRNVVFFFFVLGWTRKGLTKLKGRGILGTYLDIYTAVSRYIFGLYLRAPGVRSQVKIEVDNAISKLQAKLIPSGPGTERHLTLPKDGWSEETVHKELENLASMNHTRWEDGLVSGTVYHGGKSLNKLQVEAISKFTVANPIHPDVFPGVRKMEAEIVAMILAMFNAPVGAAGTNTSGGTESILMACFSARQKAYMERNITEPEMIVPETGHTAFRKAGIYFGIKVHLVACPAPSYQVSIPSVSRLINRNTILLVGSAPNFPHGIIDDISALSKLAIKRKIPLHVDCCLGSFLVPFLEKAGFETEPFDFRLKGVTSISCDSHKYGFAPKGNSTILYRTSALRTYQYFISPDWSGGVYASPSMAGSRPGALIAGCWASMMNLGDSGYTESCSRIVGITKKIISALEKSPVLSSDLKIIGKPLVSVVAFTSESLNIYDISDSMSGKGWHLNNLQSPPALHVAVTLPMCNVWEKLIEDLESVVEEENEKERVRKLEGKMAKVKTVGDSAALYGIAANMPNKSIVVELATGFLNTLYKA